MRDAGGAALLYRSHDLIVWEYIKPLYVGDHTKNDPFWTGHIWECPDLFPLDNKHVLVVSVWGDHQLHYCVYYTGIITNHTLIPEHVHRLDAGPSFYAPQSMRDQAGRRVMWGWLRKGRTVEAQLRAGWSGVMSLPRILSLHPDGTLGAAPAPELAMLRLSHTHIAHVDLAATPTMLDIRGDTLELSVEFELGSATECGIRVRCSPDGSEATCIRYAQAEQQLVIDTRQASTDATTSHRDVYVAPCPLGPDHQLRLRIFLGRSVIEVFANEYACAAIRVYPTQPDSDSIHVFANGGTARLATLDAWTMRSIW